MNNYSETYEGALAMLNEAIIVYEANVTENKVIRGFDYWKEEINLENIKNDEYYREIIPKYSAAVLSYVEEKKPAANSEKTVPGTDRQDLPATDSCPAVPKQA